MQRPERRATHVETPALQSHQERIRGYQKAQGGKMKLHLFAAGLVGRIGAGGIDGFDIVCTQESRSEIQVTRAKWSIPAARRVHRVVGAAIVNSAITSDKKFSILFLNLNSLIVN